MRIHPTSMYLHSPSTPSVLLRGACQCHSAETAGAYPTDAHAYVHSAHMSTEGVAAVQDLEIFF